MSGQTGDLSGIASAISRITSDPEMMNKLRSAVNGIQNESPSDVTPDAPSEGGNGLPAAPIVGSAPPATIRNTGAWSGSDRRRLLEALRPFLSSERRVKADALINIIALLDSGLIDVITKGGR